MDFTSAANEIKKSLNNLGIDLSGKVGKLTWILLLLSTLMVGESLASLAKNWEDLNIRFLAVEDVSITFLELGILLDYGFLQDNIVSLLKLCQDKFFTYKSVSLTDRKAEIITESLQNEVKNIRNTSNLAFLIVANAIFSPLLKIVLKLLTENQSLSQDTLLLPIEFIYPSFFRPNLFTFAIVYAVQIVYAWKVIINICIIFYGAYVSSMNRVCTEMRLFIVSLKELNPIFGMKMDDYNLVEPCAKVPFSLKEKMLKEYFKELVQHHYIIIEKLHLLNKGVSVTTTVLVQYIVFIVCLSLYHCVESTDFMVKMNYTFMLIPSTLLYLLVCMFGQRIVQKGEDIRRALYECPWVSSPLWFQKGLLKMITFSNKDTAVKPLKLYVINFDNFSKVMNMSYSYYNILRSFKRI